MELWFWGTLILYSVDIGALTLLSFCIQSYIWVIFSICIESCKKNTQRDTHRDTDTHLHISRVLQINQGSLPGGTIIHICSLIHTLGC